MSASPTLSHEIAAVLRDEILRQQFRCGERLPSERDLASRFNASRGAVREALSQLEQIGLIGIYPGGARIQAIESARIAILGPLMTLNETPDVDLVDQFLQTFGALAGLIARNAIDKGTDEQLNRAAEMVVSLALQSGNFEAMQPQWREFLDYLSDIADNLVVRLISNDLKSQFVEQMMKIGIAPPDPGKEATTKMLAALGKGIETRDAEMAGTAIQKHMDQIRQVLCTAILESQQVLKQAAV